MKSAMRILSTVTLLMLMLAVAVSDSLRAQESRSVIMRSQNVITWWVVDEVSGQAAFYGGDIIAICRDDPAGYDLLEFQEVQAPNEIATNLVAQGRDVGASLWDRAPPFVMPRLCHDILARGAPMATGTADITITGRFPVTWADPDVVSPFGMTATGTMETREGATMRVNAQYRCVTRGGDMRCTQNLTVR
jgi:hypothetical protein